MKNYSEIMEALHVAPCYWHDKILDTFDPVKFEEYLISRRFMIADEERGSDALESIYDVITKRYGKHVADLIEESFTNDQIRKSND